MEFMNKSEIKIFLSFFLIYSFFVQWNDVWDFNSSFSLTKAIVEEKRFEIDSYESTEVKTYYEGHYHTPIAPGISLLITWIYTIAREFTTYTPMHEFLVVIFSNPLCGALSSILIYRILFFFTNNKKHRLLTTLSYGLGTSIFPYSLGFYIYIPAIFFILLAFYLLLREKSRYKKSLKNFFLAGIFVGFAILIYSLSILIILFIFLYICITSKKMLPLFILGIIIGILPVCFYNYGILNFFIFLPTQLGYWSGKGAEWNPPNVDRLKILPRVLFYPWNGLFFYYPTLFLSLLGTILMVKKKKLESCIILIVFILMWVYTSIYSRWWGDFSFGPRRLILAIPFLVLGIPSIIEKFGLKFFLPFFIASLITNLLGLQMWLSLENVLPPPIDKTYVERVENFQIFANPLKDIYFPNFLRNGPRSLLFENFIFNREINIKFGKNIEHLEKYRIELFSLPFVTIALKIPFLCLVPLTIVVFLIWSKDIFQANKVRKFLDRKIVSMMIIILILIFFLTFIEINVES
jgi:hypothetical protein